MKVSSGDGRSSREDFTPWADRREKQIPSLRSRGNTRAVPGFPGSGFPPVKRALQFYK
jgi:hypothetical protein